MKLNEAIQLEQLLFESQFKDFKRKIRQEIVNITESDRDLLLISYSLMQQALGSDRGSVEKEDFNDPDFFMSLVRFVIDHPLSEYDLNDIQKGPERFQDETKIGGYAGALIVAMNKIKDVANQPQRQDPDYEVVDSGNNYTIYIIKNYAAARAFCNKYNTNHCIGSSNASWFPEYENEYQADTFAITARDKLIYVHSGDNGFLITSSDNTSEINDDYKERGKGLGKTVQELRQAGLSTEEIEKALSTAVGFDYASQISEMLDALRSEPTETVVYDSPQIQILTKEKNGYDVVGFKRKTDDLQLDVSDHGPNSVVITIMGSTEVARLEKVYTLLSRNFGINGTNIDRIAERAKLTMDSSHAMLMGKIAEDFL